MAQRRSDTLNLEVTPYYHCISRCVRGAFLCGEDENTGESFEHRRGWIESRLRELSGVFAVDVNGYAVMSNHFHLVVHVDAARATAWSEHEVVERYGRLFPLAKRRYDSALKQVRKVMLRAWRERLGSLSWMMRALNEWVARKANKEDGCTGRFWEGRFRCQPLLDEAAVLTCMAYVDLNPVRAGIADRLEQSDFTSISARLAAAARALDEVTKAEPAPQTAESTAPRRRATGVAAREASQGGRTERKKIVPYGLAPFADQAPERDSTGHRDVFRPRPISMKFVDYVELLEWTGRVMRPNKSGSIKRSPELLARLSVNPEAWLEVMAGGGLATTHVLGSVKRVRDFAARRGRTRARGMGFAKRFAA